MKTGYDPALRKNISVQEYQREYGSKLDAKGQPRPRPDVLCPACSERLHTVGENLSPVDATWAHDPSPSQWCPIKDSGLAKYALLAPSHLSTATASALRASFFRNWELHWSYARTFAEYADIKTFAGFIQHADRVQLWAHATLQEWQIPYTFLTTCEFPPPDGKAAARRSSWLRFCFDSKLRTLEDLWIRIIPDLRFLKLHYKPPGAGEPTARHFSHCEVFSPDANWMTRHRPAPAHAFAVRHMHARFAVELGPCPV